MTVTVSDRSPHSSKGKYAVGFFFFKFLYSNKVRNILAHKLFTRPHRHNGLCAYSSGSHPLFIRSSLQLLEENEVVGGNVEEMWAFFVLPLSSLISLYISTKT